MAYSSDDFAVWPDGTNATMNEVDRGEMNFKSDDYEIVRQDDAARLAELGIDCS